MVVALIICIPVCIIATGFLVLKSVQLGLKWQIQIKDGKEPEIKSPIEPIVSAINDSKTNESNKQREQFIKEYSPFQ
jgi:hypothetical protein